MANKGDQSISLKEPKNKKCGKCKKVVNDKGLICEYCIQWYYIFCEDITDEKYASINDSGEQTHWFCKSCNTKALEVLHLVQNMKEENDKLWKEIKEVKKKVDEVYELRNPYKEKVKDFIKEEVRELSQQEMRSEIGRAHV